MIQVSENMVFSSYIYAEYNIKFSIGTKLTHLYFASNLCGIPKIIIFDANSYKAYILSMIA